MIKSVLMIRSDFQYKSGELRKRWEFMRSAGWDIYKTEYGAINMPQRYETGRGNIGFFLSWNSPHNVAIVSYFTAPIWALI